jgi:hypothetical protein
MMPDQTRPFQIETDTSKYATGAVLTQLDANGDDTQYPLFQKHSPQQNETTKYTTGNY